MVRSLYDASRSYRYASVKLPGRLDEIVREHRQILRALRSRDAVLAEKIMNKHYENTLAWLSRTQQKNEQPARFTQSASR